MAKAALPAWSRILLCAALWACVLLYAWNHRAFLAAAAKLF